jgi:glycogen(starch) synthase
MGGSYVADHARLVARLVDRVTVTHSEEWAAGNVATAEALRPDFEAVLDAARAGGSLGVPGAVGPVLRVPVFTVGGESVPQRAEAAVRDVMRAVGRLGGDVVHGHVGYLGGLLAARLAEPAAQVFVTEHSTGLQALLNDPQGRDQYAEVLDRATRVFCVSEVLRRQLIEALPEYAARVEVMPNPVRFYGVPHREAPPERLRKWVFVGGLIERKGVERLLRAFAIAADQDREVELTIYGDGPLRERLLELAGDAGVADRLHLRGILRHADLLRQLPQYDLLVAPSRYETFHLVVPEAVAAGLPVVVTRSGGPQEALAGVENRVGRFVDVEESPDALVEAWRELDANLDGLDLEGARHDLDRRYGPDAVAGRLAEAYGLGADRLVAGAARGAWQRPQPAQRVVLLAVSGWRRTSVREELETLRATNTPAVVVTRDAQVREWADGFPVLPPATPVQPGPQGLVRRVARRLRGRPGHRPSKGDTLGVGSLRGATLLVTDMQSMPAARAALRETPGTPVIVELPRDGVHGTPADSAEQP